MFWIYLVQDILQKSLLFLELFLWFFINGLIIKDCPVMLSLYSGFLYLT
jgi:hypothetical protein